MLISGLSIKITIPVVVIAALAISLTAFLNHGKFDRTLSELEHSRTQFVVNDIHANLDTGITLGLPLKGLDNAQEVIDFEARKDMSILSISIFDETGSVVFHSGQPLASSTVPASWKPHIGSKGSKGTSDWQVTGDEETTMGTSLSSVIGTPLGGLAVRYSRSQHNAVVAAFGHALIVASLIGVGVTALVAMAGIHLLMASTSRKLGRIEECLDASLQENATTATTAASEFSLLDDVIRTSRNAMQDLSMTQLDALDAHPDGATR